MKNNGTLVRLLLIVAAAAVAMGGLSACERRKRFTQNSFNFSVSPAAASLQKQSSITLVANANGAEITPVWSVEPSSAGVFSQQFGNTVVFTAGELNPGTPFLGDCVVTAMADGEMATCQIAIVAFIPNTSNIFEMYSDSLFPNDPDRQPPAGSLLFTGGGLTISELSTGYTTQGLKYLQTTSPSNGFWGLTFSGLSGFKDLSAFNNGRIKFSLRIPAVGGLGASQNIRIDVNDGTTKNVTLNSTHGLNRLSQEYQEISIPVSEFTGLNTTTIQVPFAIVLLNISGSIVFDIDAIRWEK